MTPEPPPMTNHPIEPHPALEKVARAIWEELSRRYSVDDVECAGAARAALEALRDLPEDVVAAGEFAASLFSHNQVMSSLNGEPVEDASGQLPEVFTAMINTIIGESA